MGFEIVDGISMADIALRIYEKNLTDLFTSSANAVMSVMIENWVSISRNVEKKFKLKNIELDILLFEYLQEFIFYKDSESLFLLPDDITIKRISNSYILKGKACGEMINKKKHIVKIDVKAITMHQLMVKKKDNWIATVVLDV